MKRFITSAALVVGLFGGVAAASPRSQVGARDHRAAVSSDNGGHGARAHRRDAVTRGRDTVIHRGNDHRGYDARRMRGVQATDAVATPRRACSAVTDRRSAMAERSVMAEQSVTAARTSIRTTAGSRSAGARSAIRGRRSRIATFTTTSVPCNSSRATSRPRATSGSPVTGNGMALNGSGVRGTTSSMRAPATGTKRSTTTALATVTDVEQGEGRGERWLARLSSAAAPGPGLPPRRKGASGLRP